MIPGNCAGKVIREPPMRVAFSLFRWAGPKIEHPATHGSGRVLHECGADDNGIACFVVHAAAPVGSAVFGKNAIDHRRTVTAFLSGMVVVEDGVGHGRMAIEVVPHSATLVRGVLGEAAGADRRAGFCTFGNP